mmetsp:Transcript_86016/g.135088  ORF Transcript_86016/g.135088 Transcript_86016/m.135088 type:complete len:448 (-) Transcript_86016:125-1468(-)
MADISQVDQILMVLSTALVMFMVPGIALFYGGLVRERSTIDIMIQNFVSLGITTVVWYAFLFSMAFAPGDIIGNPSTHMMYNGLTVNTAWKTSTVSGPLFATFQMLFATLTPILMTGAFADRMRFGPYCVFLVAWLVLVYGPCCHQIWGGGLAMKEGICEWAGGIVVHISSGWSGLAVCVVLGKRKVKAVGGELPEPHNIPIVVVGTGILWFGWFGFNGGSALAMNGDAVASIINTQIAAAVSMCVWCGIDWLREGRAKIVPMCTACLAGLVVVTPLAGFVSSDMAALSGLFAGTLCYAAVYVSNVVGVDDALSVWGVHGMGGAIGSILVGVMADSPKCEGSPTQLYIQCKAVAISIVYCFGVTYTLVKVMSLITQITPIDNTDDFLFDSLDYDLHGEVAYSMAPGLAPLGGEDGHDLLARQHIKLASNSKNKHKVFSDDSHLPKPP